jgi:exodeoxyribonuclease V alpha subunit
MASRELLYTGITRARHSLVLSASEAALSAAVLSPTRRDSGLRDRLTEAA